MSNAVDPAVVHLQAVATATLTNNQLSVMRIRTPESSAATIQDDDDEVHAFVTDEDDTFSDNTLATDDDLEYYNFDENDEMAPHLVYTDWLTNTAATLHITNRRDAFITYESIPAITIMGVGSTKTCTIGQGDINLRSECDGQPYLLKLRNVLHVPENKNNLFSLGQWEKDGRSIYVNDGVIALHMRNGIIAAKGHKIHNNLYKICFAISPVSVTITCAFIADDHLPTWENWHRQFVHVNYRGIKKLLDAHMVEGLQINSSSPKPDCIACTEAKLSQLPYGSVAPRITKPGELTHMDLWGKYPIQSINGNTYSLVMVDDAS